MNMPYQGTGIEQGEASLVQKSIESYWPNSNFNSVTMWGMIRGTLRPPFPKLPTTQGYPGFFNFIPLLIFDRYDEGRVLS